MPIRSSSSDETSVVTIDRPPVNALDFEAIVELEHTFAAIARAAPSRGVVLTGAGSAFSAGVDTRAFAGCAREQRIEMFNAITRMVAALLGIPGPVVAAVNGHALGGGFVLMLACDYRIVCDVEQLKLGNTEAQAGIPFPVGPAELIKHELTPGLLRRSTLASAILSAKELLAASTIDEICPSPDLLSIAIARANALASQLAFRPIKRQMRGALADRIAGLAAAGQDPSIDAIL